MAVVKNRRFLQYNMTIDELPYFAGKI